MTPGICPRPAIVPTHLARRRARAHMVLLPGPYGRYRMNAPMSGSAERTSAWLATEAPIIWLLGKAQSGNHRRADRHVGGRAVTAPAGAQPDMPLGVLVPAWAFFIM